jgi:hypothetical protein
MSLLTRYVLQYNKPLERNPLIFIVIGIGLASLTMNRERFYAMDSNHIQRTPG